MNYDIAWYDIRIDTTSRFIIILLFSSTAVENPDKSEIDDSPLNPNLEAGYHAVWWMTPVVEGALQLIFSLSRFTALIQW